MTHISPDTILLSPRPGKAWTWLLGLLLLSFAAQPFQVIAQAPTISSFSPLTGVPGSAITVTLTGTNFTGATSVSFNGALTTGLTVNSSTRLTAYVPIGATTGPLTVTTPNGSGTSAGSFTVTAITPDVVVTVTPTGPLSACGAPVLTASAVIRAFNPSGSGLNNTISAVAVQPDGKLLVGGLFTSYNGITRNRISRLNADGSLDASFAATGTGLNGNVNTIALQPDGKVLVGGPFTAYNNITRRSVARLNADGTLDASFAPTGAGLNNVVYSVAVQPDGKVLVGGWFTLYDVTARNYVVRLTATGALDASFAPTGTGLNNTVQSLAMQPDGKVLVGGTFTTYNGATANRVARLNADGSLDGTFAPTGTGINNNIAALTMQPDGKVVVVGNFTAYNGIARGRVARLNTDGTLDATFAATGTGSNNTVGTLAVQPDGKVLIGGYLSSYNGTARSYIARLSATGALDPIFTNTGVGFNNFVAAISVQPDGKVIVSGGFTAYNGTARDRLVRLNADGSLDAVATSTGATATYQWTTPGGSTGPTVAAAAAGGNYQVTATVSGYAFLSNVVTVTSCVPTLTSVSPTQGPVGTSLTLTGTNLLNTSLISFGGSSANTVGTGYTINSTGTQITGLLVPAGAQTGAISILTPSGTATTATAFILPPVATDDARFTPSNTALTFGPITSNDTDADGNATIVTSSIDLNPALANQQTTRTITAEGSYLVDTRGYLTFTPVASFTGTSTITYTVQDNTGGLSNAANLTVFVGPSARANTATTAYNVAVAVNVTTNATDANGVSAASVDLDPSTAGRQTAFTVAGQGAFTVDSTGLVSFTPSGTFVGLTTASYTVNDNTGATSNATTLTVTTTNTAPVAVPDASHSTPSNTPLTFNVVDNDTDANGNATIDRATVDLDPTAIGIQPIRSFTGQGIFTVDPLGSVTFTPARNFTGTLPFAYTVRDALGAESNVASSTQRIGPLATSDSAVSILGRVVRLSAGINDTDAEGVDLTTVDLLPALPGIQRTVLVAGKGEFSTDQVTGEVVFTPDAAFTGGSQVSLTYVVSDNSGAVSNEATLYVSAMTTADLATTIGGTQAASAGQTVTYTASAKNRGPGPAYQVVVRVQLPLNLLTPTGQPLTVAGGVYTASTGVLSFGAIPTLVGGQTVNQSVVFRMPNSSVISATVTSTAAANQDPDNTNNNGSQMSATIVTGNTLPVELVRFVAQAQLHSVLLQWTTASEHHSAYFAVERSADDYSFAAVGLPVAAAGESSTVQSYELTDPSPLPGISYYRLRQVDRDNQSRLSDVQGLSFGAAAGRATVYPNPTTATAASLDLTAVAAGTYQVEIFDLTGRRLLAPQYLPSGLIYPLPTAALGIGTYMLRLTHAPTGHAQTLRLVRQ